MLLFTFVFFSSSIITIIFTTAKPGQRIKYYNQYYIMVIPVLVYTVLWAHTVCLKNIMHIQCGGLVGSCTMGAKITHTKYKIKYMLLKILQRHVIELTMLFCNNLVYS